MSDYTPTPEAVEAFKRAWHEADAEGDTGNRVLRGLTAAGPIIAEMRSDEDRATVRAIRDRAARRDNPYRKEQP